LKQNQNITLALLIACINQPQPMLMNCYITPHLTDFILLAPKIYWNVVNIPSYV